MMTRVRSSVWPKGGRCELRLAIHFVSVTAHAHPLVHSADDVNWAAGKLTALRLWPSADGSKPWDRSVTDIGGGIL